MISPSQMASCVGSSAGHRPGFDAANPGWIGRELLDHVGAVLLGIAGQHRDQHGNADAGAQISQQRVDRRALGTQPAAASVAKVSTVSGGKTRPRPKPSRTPFQTMRAFADIEIEERHVVERGGALRHEADARSGCARPSRHDQTRDKHHRHHHARAARRQHNAGGEHRIAHELLQERRHQGRRHDQHEAGQRREARARP